jgi:SAM-dependent methyltransferase
MRTTSCALCGSRNSCFLFAAPAQFGSDNRIFSFVQCKKCGLIYLNPRPDNSELTMYYEMPAYRKGNRMLDLLANLLSHRLAARSIAKFKPEGRVLDVGCGTGSFLLQMIEKGYEVYGQDISKTTCDILRSRVGAQCFDAPLEKCNFRSGFFDIITLWHVLEHVEDPNTLLTEVHRILKPEGLLVIEVPNYNSIVVKLFGRYSSFLGTPLHLYSFSVRTLEMILIKNGFLCVRSIFPILRGLPYSVLGSASLALRTEFNNRKLGTAVYWALLPLLLLVALALRVPILVKRSYGDTIRVHCKKDSH